MPKHLWSVLALTVVLAGCERSQAPTPATPAPASPTPTAQAPEPAAQPEPAQPAATVQIDGSSTVYPILEAVAEEFQVSTNGRVRVTVGVSGTGGGFKKFCRGETDISNGSRPILREEMDSCAASGINFVEIPIAYDALTVVVNPDNEFLTSITIAELKKIWEPGAQGYVTRWNQVNPAWPDSEIKLYGAGSDSGTFDYFTEAVVGKAKSSRGDYTAAEDDNVLVQGISQDLNAIGYFGFAYYIANQQRLRAVGIALDENTPPVLPTSESVIDGSYVPLSRPLFVYVKVTALDRPEVAEFVDFLIDNAPALTAEVKYVPLPAEVYAAAKNFVRERRAGSVFGGVPETNVSIKDLIERERVL